MRSKTTGKLYMSQKIKIKSPVRRNSSAIAGHHRHAGPMKDRRAPRGGARNAQKDILDELDEQEDDCGTPADEPMEESKRSQEPQEDN